MTLLGALLLGFAIVLAIAAGLWGLTAYEQKRVEALEALAARRGWSLNLTKQSLGHPSILRLTPKSGPAWQVEVRHHPGRGGKPGRSVTLFHAPGTTWDDGLMIIGPSMGAENAEIAGAILRQFDNQVARALLRRVVGQDTGDHIPDLTAWDQSETHTLFASSDPALRTDLKDLTKVYADWTPMKSGEAGQPVMVLNGTGLRTGLGHGLHNAAKLETFIDYAIRLNRHFSRP